MKNYLVIALFMVSAIGLALDSKFIFLGSLSINYAIFLKYGGLFRNK